MLYRGSHSSPLGMRRSIQQQLACVEIVGSVLSKSGIGVDQDVELMSVICQLNSSQPTSFMSSGSGIPLFVGSRGVRG